jgi:HK97 gp10 family phage protein
VGVGGRVTIVKNHFPKALRRLQPAMAKAVAVIAAEVQAEASQNAPIDTGFLRNSIRMQLFGQDGSPAAYPSGPVYSRARKKMVTIKPVSIEPYQPPRHELEAIVAVGAHYGIYVELGTDRMGAQPYLLPAVEAVRPKVQKIVEHYLNQMLAQVTGQGGLGL